jgi:molecular chaperone Hsp33
MSESDAPLESRFQVRPRQPERADELVRTISTSGGIAVKALIAHQLVAEALSLRPHTATAGDALGRTMMGALLIAVGSAADDADEANVESVQLQVRGDGPLGGITAIGDSRARVRGNVREPGIEMILKDGSPDIARAVGLGPLHVVRHRPRWKSPYTGTVPLVSGEIAGDLTLYLTESEQTPSALGLGVAFGPQMVDVGAAGFLVQALPGATDDEVGQVEENIAGMPGLASLLGDAITASDLIDRLLIGLGSRERHRMRPKFYCPCTRDRARRTLALLDREEIDQLVASGNTQEVVCDFCGRDYQISGDEILGVAQSARSGRAD